MSNAGSKGKDAVSGILLKFFEYEFGTFFSGKGPFKLFLIVPAIGELNCFVIYSFIVNGKILEWAK